MGSNIKPSQEFCARRCGIKRSRLPHSFVQPFRKPVCSIVELLKVLSVHCPQPRQYSSLKPLYIGIRRFDFVMRISGA